MKKAKRFGMIALAAVIGFSMTGCPSSTSEVAAVGEVTVNEVTVDGLLNVIVVRGGTHTFAATVVGTYNPPQTVNWTILQANRHDQTAINANTGALSVAAAETLAKLTVRAASTHDPARSGTVNVIVAPEEGFGFIASAGSSHTVAVRTDGTLWAYRQPQSPSNPAIKVYLSA